ncbi:MAG: SDR family oxidoreductase [Flavobacteriaceae bacterium]
MNIITGSSGGLGKVIYKKFKKLNLPVLGIDVVQTNYTDIVTDLSSHKNIQSLSKEIKFKIDTITFAHALGNSKNEINSYNLNQYRYINADSNLDFLLQFSSQFTSETSVAFLSSVHSIATNSQSGNYAISKQNLESIYRYITLNNSEFNFNKCMFRIGAMDTPMLRNNVENLDTLKKEIPSKKIIEPKALADLIIDFHLNYKQLLNCSILQIDGGVLYKPGTD